MADQLTSTEVQPGGHLRQDVPAGLGLPNHQMSSEENAMVEPPDHEAVTSKRVARLATEAAEAARIRALTTHPDVIALRVEKVRTQVDALLWAGIVLGLAFTAVNVQAFAAGDAEPWSLEWLVAWLLDPMVSLVLLAVLRAEQVTARYQVALPVWARRTKWLTFAATYVMNTWTSWGFDGGGISWSGVVLHSVPPLVVFATAETGPGLRDRLTEAVRRALIEHAAETATNATASTGTSSDTSTASEVREPVHEQAPAEVHDAPTEPLPVAAGERSPARRRPARRKGKQAPRRLLADYLADARAALDDAHARGEHVEVSPAWARRVTGCSAGTSVKLAAALRTPTTVPTTSVSAAVEEAA